MIKPLEKEKIEAISNMGTCVFLTRLFEDLNLKGEATLLWENPNPSGDFTCPQTISIPECANYNLFLYVFCQFKSYWPNSKNVQVFILKNTKTGDGTDKDILITDSGMSITATGGGDPGQQVPELLYGIK